MMRSTRHRPYRVQPTSKIAPSASLPKTAFWLVQSGVISLVVWHYGKACTAVSLAYAQDVHRFGWDAVRTREGLLVTAAVILLATAWVSAVLVANGFKAEFKEHLKRLFDR